MEDLNQTLLEIENKYSKLKEGQKKELMALLKNLSSYLSSKPTERKLHAMALFIQKAQNKKGKQLRIVWDDISVERLQELRNSIAHNKSINVEDLVSFSNILWEEMPRVYEYDKGAIYNTLSYAIRPSPGSIYDTLPDINQFSSTREIVRFFKNIYESRTINEKVEIMKTLIPLITITFKDYSIRHGNKWQAHGN